MKNIKKLLKCEFAENIKMIAASILLIYMLISLYFMYHFFFITVINGVDVSLKAHDGVDEKFISYTRRYRLQLTERNGETEEIIGQDIGLKYNRKGSSSKAYMAQISFKWPSSLLKEQRYYIKDLFIYNNEYLENRISELNCLNREIIEPRSVSFEYANGYYKLIEEVYGNKLNKDRLYKVIKSSVSNGQTRLDLNKSLCYEDPKYTLTSNKTPITKNLLDTYVSTKITYIFGSEEEVLDQNTINKWLSVDEDLEVVIDEKEVMHYMQDLSRKYDTVGAVRKFRASTNKTLEVKGGFYGWKMNCAAETQALLEDIKHGNVLEKEPIFIQTALSRGKNDIGNTYIEINLTRQHLWFYKNGKLITHGPVVTGNPSRGNATETGVYFLNYKQTGSTLIGPDYEADVTYWMPFNGNIGIHDASWRYHFGGIIYKSNGTHGCVNVPLNLAKGIYNNIKEGTPVICYEE
jgi:hypothetical protein